MIVTLTPNPSIDRTVTVQDLNVGEVNRAESSRIDPGGKGVNVSRALHAHGHDTLAVLPLGGPDGATLGRLLEDARVPFVPVTFEGRTRTNIALVDMNGVTTKINEPGPRLGEDTLAALVAAVPDEADWVVLSGRLATGIPPQWLAEVVTQVPGKVVVDSSGPALAAAVAQHPFLIKPNRAELEELSGQDLPTLGHIVAVSRQLIGDGVGVVVTSLGADGALWVDEHETWFASARVDHPMSSVGAGDCLLAGVLSALAEGLDARQALTRGVAWGAAAVAQPGSAVPGPDDVARVAVSSTDAPDLAAVLTD